MTITKEQIREHGLSDEEYARIKVLLGGTDGRKLFESLIETLS